MALNISFFEIDGSHITQVTFVGTPLSANTRIYDIPIWLNNCTVEDICWETLSVETLTA